MARGRESFFDGVMRGYMAHQEILRQQKKDKQDEEDRAIRNRQAGIQEQLLGLQRDAATRAGDRDRARAEAEAKIRAAGRVGIDEVTIPGKEDGETQTIYRVGNEEFKSRAGAVAAMERANMPIAAARRQMQAAAESGDSELAQRYGQLYEQTRNTTMEDARQAFMEAYRTGGAQGIADLYNKQVNDGKTMVLQRGPNGRLMVATYVGGKAAGEPTVYADEQDFVQSQVAAFQKNPEAIVDFFHKRATLGENRRQFDEGMKFKQQEFDWQKKYQQGQLEIGQGQVAAAQTSAGAAAKQAATGEWLASKPTNYVLDNGDGTSNVVSSRWPIGASRPVVADPAKVPGVRRPQPATPWGNLGGQPGAAGGPGLNLSEDALARIMQAGRE